MPHPDIQKNPSSPASNPLDTGRVQVHRQVEGIELYQADSKIDVDLLDRVHWNTKASLNTDEEPNGSICW
ncbi:MAG: hypothetical protein P8J75_06420 [Actinomycetota bacterium]|jgi:hypothetical protein|nr:hypothetical protein [Actinomycetota bacterium]